MQQDNAAVKTLFIKEILGYLNFSTGNRDVRFLTALNKLFVLIDEETISMKSSVKEVIRKTAKLDRLDPVTDTDFLAYRVIEAIEQGLTDLSRQSDAFRVEDQAGLVLRLIRVNLLPEYRKFHQELLFHQSNNFLFNSLFLGKAFEAVLKQGSPWMEIERIVPEVISELNDYIGYRPVPVLEGEEKHQPYTNEWIAPLPLYMKDVGVAYGRYQKVVDKALEILRETDSQILYEACFSLDKLKELVLDPRAYDFDHPVNRKPNYHFGLWDPQAIDKDGFYQRFVVHQVTLDGILSRLESAYTGEDSDAVVVPEDELLYEAGAVLVGTMLMGSGVCGDTPSTYDSETSLTTLMPIIAAYRDRFYEQIVDKIPNKMKPRIKKEQERLFQPFGGCRQSLNKQLAKRRADQLQRMHLARIFARMGYFEAAEHQSDVIQVASARIMTRIDCLITETHFDIDRRQLDQAGTHLPEIEERIRRGIACGAIVDPWTILGFGANYSLFHSIENSIHDHRVDDLINLLEDIFDLYSRLQKEAAAAGKGDLQADLSDKMSDLAGWWDQYGSTQVSGLESFSGVDAWESAAKVSTALAVWHQAGTAAGDVAFWNRHVERFNSTKAYVLLCEALLDQRDPVASMALMMHWLSNSETIPLTEGDYSFHSIALRWMEQLWNVPPEPEGKDGVKEDDKILKKRAKRSDSDEISNGKKDEKPDSQLDVKPKTFPPMSLEQRWNLTKKFFDFTEANADRYWRVPEIELDDSLFDRKGQNPDSEDEELSDILKQMREMVENEDDLDEAEMNALLDDYFDDDDDTGDNGNVEDEEGDEDSGIDPLYRAAYENVTYHDTTDDGVDDSMMESKPANFRDEDDLELATETERISDRLTFIVTMAKLWKFVAEKVAAQYPPSGSTPLAVSDGLDQKHTISGEPSKELSEKSETGNATAPEEVSQYLETWLGQVIAYSDGLVGLLDKAARYRVPPPRGTADSLLEYDRHRGTKEILIDRIVWTHVEVYDARMMLESYLGEKHWKKNVEPWRKAVLEINHLFFQGDTKKLKRRWDSMLRILSRETILYVPTSRGGSASAIVRCRCVQQAIMRLMEYAPQLGLLTESFKILETIREMEETNTVKPGAITEFDRLVETATRAITRCVAESSKTWKGKTGERDWVSPDFALVEYMEKLIELLLKSWLEHSRQIRISPIESITDRSYWNEIKEFIQRYGKDIFTQQFMGFGNLRAMLHQGVDNFLRSLIKIKKDEGEVEMASSLINDIESGAIDWESAVSRLEIIFESIAENYSEYVDYNSTTTHSDHGEKLYMLLDMLRVQIGYERISWNLKPVYWVHDAMIRCGCDSAAMLWERAVAKRSVNAAEEHIRQYQRLSEKYGMWLPSVHERLQERFVRPLQVDRMCGLVPKAMRQARQDDARTAFAELYDQVENFAKEPMGVGFEMPEWLTALQDEVMATRTDESETDKDKESFGLAPHFERVAVTRSQLEKIIDTLNRRERFS